MLKPLQGIKQILRIPYWLNLRSLLPELAPVVTDKPLIRLGSAHDGGYLVPDDLDDIACCFSPGVSSISDFENECAKRDMKVFLADASIDAPALTHPLFHFSKKFIGRETKGDFITLKEWVAASLGADDEKDRDLILQMDIEGFEWEVLDHIEAELLNRFRIIVIEFHGMHQFDFRKKRVFQKLLKSHACVHIHPNNSSPLRRLMNIEVPALMEFTFFRRDRIKTAEQRFDFPHALDEDNTPKAHLPLPSCWYPKPSN